MEDTAITIQAPFVPLDPLAKKPFTISEKGAWYYVIGQVVVCITLVGVVIGVIVWYAGQ